MTGIILIGATHTLTDSANLSQYFTEHKIPIKVVCIPSTLDGNIRHGFFQCSLGFDTATKVYSQLIGNMLTDSASAIKYWYFIRLMGRDPSHLVLECALKTHPNMVIISEESSFRQESLMDIVHRVCDTIVKRSNQGKDYGSILIPEGLLSHISSYRNLIQELNELFSHCTNEIEQQDLSSKLWMDETQIKQLLSPCSYSLYATLPEFMRL